MSNDPTAQEADRRLQEALDASGARDPRDFYRERLRELKRDNPEGYGRAVAYYRQTLIPDVAAGSPPLEAWTEYGRRLAEQVAPGRTVSVDPSGRARPYEAPVVGDALVLHLPSDTGARALLVGLPPELSPAQKATYDVLVSGKQRLRDDSAP